MSVNVLKIRWRADGVDGKEEQIDAMDYIQEWLFRKDTFSFAIMHWAIASFKKTFVFLPKRVDIC